MKNEFAQVFPEELKSEILLNTAIKRLEDEKRIRHLVEGLCIKSKLGLGDIRTNIKNVKKLANELNEILAINILKAKLIEMGLKYNDI